MDTDGTDAAGNKPSAVVEMYRRIGYMYQFQMDRMVPFVVARWVFLALLAVFYFARVFVLQGWYIVTYALGIYFLNLFIAFLSPKIDPAMHEMEEDEDGPSLPMKQNEEFKPFMRRLPEFKFWHAGTKAFLISTFCTFFEAFNIPVFWPILVLYFFLLTFVTLKKQIKHMIKYRYLPFTRGKTVYQGKEEKLDPPIDSSLQSANGPTLQAQAMAAPTLPACSSVSTGPTSSH